MSVTFFNDGLTVSDDAAARADAFCEVVALGPYMNAHDGLPPTGWPNNAARKALIEWTIKNLIATRVRQWEVRVQQDGIIAPPWDGMAR